MGVPFTILLNENTLKSGILRVRQRDTTLMVRAFIYIYRRPAGRRALARDRLKKTISRIIRNNCFIFKLLSVPKIGLKLETLIEI